MLGAGGVVVVVLSAWAGRLPILFYFLLFATATTDRMVRSSNNV